MFRLASIAAFVVSLTLTSAAQAGPYTDDLSKCLVQSTSANDRIAFMQWMFSAMALHPAVSKLSSITPDQRVAFDKNAANLLVRLMSADCRQQTISAIKYEGTAAMQTSFQIFGQVAMRGLMGDPHVAEGLNTLGTYFANNQAWLSFLRDAGLAKSP
jgi:hypothetical protein